MGNKAWIVQDDYEGYSVVVFHSHGLAARRLGAEEMNLEFEGVECSRAPELDKYSDKGYVPPDVLINEHGWWYDCYHCGKHVDEDTERVVFTSDDRVFCCPKCVTDFNDEVKQINSEYEQFQIAILNSGFQGTITGFEGGYPILTPCAYWTFPGAKFEGSMIINRKEKKLMAWIAHGDREAYEKWTERKRYGNRKRSFKGLERQMHRR